MPYRPTTHKAKRIKPQVRRSDRLRWNWKWQKLSRRQRDLFPVCKAPGCIRPSEEVHHILPLETHPELAYEPRNCVPLCKECHLRADSFNFDQWWDGEGVKGIGGSTTEKRPLP